MEDRVTERMMYLALGTVAAVALGPLLMPLRTLTPASNLTFAFLALTIVIADLGGAAAAVATAVASALSLDFFLTRPYLSLAVADKHDVIACLGLAGCGLVAAGLGAWREERLFRLRGADRQLRLLRQLLAELSRPVALEIRVENVRRAARTSAEMAEAAAELAPLLAVLLARAQTPPSSVADLHPAP